MVDCKTFNISSHGVTTALYTYFCILSYSSNVQGLLVAAVQPQLLFKQLSTDGNKNRKTIFNENDSSTAAVHQHSTQDKG